LWRLGFLEPRSWEAVVVSRPAAKLEIGGGSYFIEVRRVGFANQVAWRLPIDRLNSKRIHFAEWDVRSRLIKRNRLRPAFREHQRADAVPNDVVFTDLKAVKSDAIYTVDWRILYDSNTHQRLTTA
jgi:hypothetical protein